MQSLFALKSRMYLTLLLVLAVGFAIIYVLLALFGAPFIGILLIALIFFLLQWYISPILLRIASHLRYIKDGEYPELHEMVKKLANGANVPEPRIAISPSKEPNAFVFGRTRKSATLVVHQGLLDMLDNDELESVLAHEIGHLKHNDVVIITLVSFIPLLAYIIAENFFFGGFYSGNRNQFSYLMLIGMAAFAVYFVTELLMLSLSRIREIYADSYSASATKKPENLARALAKITYGISRSNAQPSKNAASAGTRALYIADNVTVEKDIKEILAHAAEIKKLVPEIDIEALKEATKRERGRHYYVTSMFMTHPPTYKRIIMLAKMK
ncbi:MAG: zinc metalloprotease HtpX [Candidatus Micrarchaeia archaeon]